jgi:hypothetical protein
MYFKIIKEYEKNDGRPYRAGMNILSRPDIVQRNGLIFTNRINLPYFYTSGIYCHPVHLPKADPQFKMVPDILSWRANKIFLGERHRLSQITTYNKFSLRLPSISQILWYGYHHVTSSAKQMKYRPEINPSPPMVVKKIIDKKYNLSIDFGHCWDLENMYWDIILSEYWDLIKIIMDNYNHGDHENHIIILLTILAGDLRLLRFISNYIPIDNSFGLVRSAEKGHLHLVKYFLSRGVDINTHNSLALIQCCKYGHLEVVKYLVSRGANVHAADDAAYRMCYLYNHTSLISYFESIGFRRDRIYIVPNITHIF